MSRGEAPLLTSGAAVATVCSGRGAKMRRFWWIGLGAFAWTAAWAQNPTARPTFEVASVKPSAAADNETLMMRELRARATEGMYSGQAPGWLPLEKTRLRMRYRTLAGLIASAYRVRVVQVAGPAWMAEVQFDIEATMPEGAAPGTVNEMLQALLEERFGLEVHREEKETSGFAL